MPVRLREGALQGAGQEHRTGDDSVCAIESLDGKKAVAGDDRRVRPQAGF